jgi:hypothetical protein
LLFVVARSPGKDSGWEKVRPWPMSDKFLNTCRNDPKVARFELMGCSNWRDGSKAIDAITDKA